MVTGNRYSTLVWYFKNNNENKRYRDRQYNIKSNGNLRLPVTFSYLIPCTKSYRESIEVISLLKNFPVDYIFSRITFSIFRLRTLLSCRIYQATVSYKNHNVHSLNRSLCSFCFYSGNIFLLQADITQRPRTYW